MMENYDYKKKKKGYYKKKASKAYTRGRNTTQRVVDNIVKY